MVRAIAGSIIIVLLVGSSALALGDIFQGFSFETNLTGSIELPAGPGSGSLFQNVMLGNNQEAESVGTAASQGLQGMLMQSGNADGLCAGLTVDQTLFAISIDPTGQSGSAGQIQNISGSLGQIGQGQGVGVIGTQFLAKGLGPGSADASNNVFLNQGQEASNVLGAASEMSCLAVMQNSEISGGPGSTGSVITGMQAGTAQVQTVGQLAQ